MLLGERQSLARGEGRVRRRLGTGRQQQQQQEKAGPGAHMGGDVPLPVPWGQWFLLLPPLQTLTSSSRRRDSSWYLSLNSGLNFWSRSVSTFFKSS